LNNGQRGRNQYISGLLKPYRGLITLLVLLFLAASVFDGISIGMLVPLLGSIQQVQNYGELPKILQTLINTFSQFPVEKQILYSLLLVVFAVILKNIFLAISHYLSYWLTVRITVNIRSQIINTLMTVSIGYYSNVKTGDLVEKVSYNTVLIEEIIKTATEFLDYLASFLVLLILLVIFSLKLTIVTIALAVIIAFALSIHIKKLSKIGHKYVESAREFTSTLHESISGIEVIKSFTKENAQSEKLEEKIEKNAEYRLQYMFSNYMVHVLTEALGVIAIGVLFIIAVTSSKTDYRLMITQLLPFIYILARMLPLIKLINHARGTIAGRWPAFTAVYDLVSLQNKPLIKDGIIPYTGLKHGIEFKSVTFSYSEDNKHALTDASFNIPKGKTTALVGKSGAGKSTVINLLLRFYDTQDGSILIDGKPISSFLIESYRKNIGMVSQDTFIFNDSVKNNIAFGALDAPPDDATIIEAARRAGADEFIKELPDGYNSMLGERGVRLSGGQRQRISIARAILKNPEILILDEATSSLDTKTEQLIHKAITELSRNRTVVIIAHRLSTIKNADQIIVLKDGRVSEIGTEPELMDKKGEYYSLSSIIT